jgi:hypothetical protein
MGMAIPGEIFFRDSIIADPLIRWEMALKCKELAVGIIPDLEREGTAGIGV